MNEDHRQLPGILSVVVSGGPRGIASQRAGLRSVRNQIDKSLRSADMAVLRRKLLNRDVRQFGTTPWAMEMKSISIEEPDRLVQTLTGAILGCGGWLLGRGANHFGVVNMLFEFERQNSADIYCALIGSGLELSEVGHASLTALCECTNWRPKSCGKEVACIELEIQTFPCRR